VHFRTRAMARTWTSDVPDSSFKDKFRTQFRKTQMCKFFEKGKCRRGTQCMFAHDKEEQQQRPDLDRTALCPYKQTCMDPECKYAHRVFELQRTEQFEKITPCRYHLAGHCKFGDDCLHSHSEAPQKTTNGDSNSPCACDALPPWSRSTTKETAASTLPDPPSFSRTSTTTSTHSSDASSSSVWSEGYAAQGFWAGTEPGGVNALASASHTLWQAMPGGQYSGGQQPPTMAPRSKEGIPIPAAWLQNGGVSSSEGLVAVGNCLVTISEHLEDKAT